VRIRTSDPAYSIPDTVPVHTYRDYFTGYRRHPEAKAAATDGQPCLPDSRGLLQPLVVEAETVVRIGKEAARLIDAEDAPDEDDRAVVYRPRECRGCTQPVTGRRQWCSEACRKRTSRSART
jgi:hypothetical protein